MKITMEEAQRLYDLNLRYFETLRKGSMEELKSPSIQRDFEQEWEILLQTDGTATERVFVSSITTSFAQAGLSISRYRKCLEVCGVEVIG